MQSALADSGLFIGLFDADDKHHARCAAFIEGYRGRLVTTWQVLTEALAMLSACQQAKLLTWIHRGVSSSLIRIECTDPADLPKAIELTEKYRDQPMDFADASIYLLALRTGITSVVSVDRKDFAIYRLPGKKSFTNLLR